MGKPAYVKHMCPDQVDRRNGDPGDGDKTALPKLEYTQRLLPKIRGMDCDICEARCYHSRNSCPARMLGPDLRKSSMRSDEDE